MRLRAAPGILAVAIALAINLHAADARSPSRITTATDISSADKSARAPTPRVRKQTPYEEAREHLLSSGWTPAASPNADKCQEGDGRCQGRPEMESCSGAGEANCLFLWRKGKVIIAVSTIADPPVIAGIRCRSGCKPAKSTKTK